jgi:hypothetical protein
MVMVASTTADWLSQPLEVAVDLASEHRLRLREWEHPNRGERAQEPLQFGLAPRLLESLDDFEDRHR